MKPTKTQIKYMHEFDMLADETGCLTVGEWTSGRGRYTKPRVLPIGVTRYDRKDDLMPREVRYYFDSHPRRRAVLWIDRISLRQAGLM